MNTQTTLAPLYHRELAKPTRRIGVISDTHGLLREEAMATLAGSDLIIHAGDVGESEILERLRTLAPVVAVRGNIDKDAWASALPKTAVVETGAALIYVIHGIHELDLDPVAAGFAVVISGHSHRPSCMARAGVLYLNPGSAGPRRFRLPITLARMSMGSGSPEVEIVDLADDA
jgi:putative phosphoesterase